ncbi:mechanosensitive ion channel family protein [Salisediminibacterium beveridgei]|uniref:MscS family membrane protein n=1 Tax=Salisediminibacterium beveridgei TaxID=632773 RepID=A0A1D7QWF6_9BACI|nr:mechanosensitive ion channel family protein [Salisediminibacterium beveridgei]AOM83336.1 hypothetical protein BBEV_1975 [Salisediminibacterium beveridgei]
MDTIIDTDHWYLSFTLQEIAISIAIFFIFLLFRKLFTKYVFQFVLYLSRKAPIDLVTNVLLAFEKPLRLLFVFFGIYASLRYLSLPESIDANLAVILRSLIIIHIAVGLYNLSASNSLFFRKIGDKMNLSEDDILIPFLSKLIRVAIIVMMLSVVASEWQYNVSGFVAGLGLGGLAFALAAQDTLANFFGGVIIITDKPFTIGDWIKTPSTEGFVEDINFRSTKIRTFADTIVVIPNKTVAHEPIENMSKMRKRLVSYNLGVMYATSTNQMETCVKRIEDLLRNSKDVDQELIIVNFTEFNDSSLDILIYYFTKPTGWVEHLKIKESLNISVMKILEEEGVSVAFPTRSIYMENDVKQMKEASEDESN